MWRRLCNAGSPFQIIYFLLHYGKGYFPCVNGTGNTLEAFVYNNDLKRMFRKNQTICNGGRAYENCIFQHKTI